jgi:hypothetical protein
MADGSFPGLVSRNRDVNSTSNVIYTGITDDAGNLVSVTSNALDVNATNAAIHVDDAAFTIATDSVSASGFLADETAPDSVDEGDIGLARMTLDRKILTRIVGSTDANRLEIDASGYATVNVNGTVTVSASDLDIRDIVHTQDSVALGDGTGVLVDVLDSTIDALQVAISDGTDQLAVNTDGSINVNIVNSTITGEVHDYDTAAAVASDASDNHDYAVVNSTFLLKSVIVAGSGNIKFEIQTGPVASLATVAVGFLTGRQGDTKQVFFDPAIEVPVASTGTVRVIRTNRQGSATDLYSTIIGLDI